MKKFFVLIIVILAVALVFGCGKKKQEEAATPEQAQPAQVEEAAGQVTCVVCGMAVDTSQVKIMMDYQGKTYYFCSEDDKAKFEADPDKYMKKEEGAEAEESKEEMH